MSEALLVRPLIESAGPEGVAAASRVFAAALDEAWPRADLEVLLASGRGQLFLARSGAGSVVEGALLSECVHDEAHVHLLAVDAGARRRGVGGALLEAALADARASGARRMFLEVRVSRRAALALYARHGFRRLHRRHRYYADGEDALLLARSTAPDVIPVAGS